MIAIIYGLKSPLDQALSSFKTGLKIVFTTFTTLQHRTIYYSNKNADIVQADTFYSFLAQSVDCLTSWEAAKTWIICGFLRTEVGNTDLDK